MRNIPGTDLAVHALSLGGNVFGWTADEAESFRRARRLRGGGRQLRRHRRRLLRVGAGQPGGESETILGNWFASRGNRDDDRPRHQGRARRPTAACRAETIKAGAEESLRRLQTDWIDLYYTHHDDASAPVEETIGALDELVNEGKVRDIAASNFPPERLESRWLVCEREGLARYVALQPHYNLVARDTSRASSADVAARHGWPSSRTTRWPRLPHRQVPPGRTAVTSPAPRARPDLETGAARRSSPPWTTSPPRTTAPRHGRPGLAAPPSPPSWPRSPARARWTSSAGAAGR